MASELSSSTDASSKPGGASLERPGRTKPRILVVDDDDAIARFFARVLSDYDVQWAASGLRAKSMLQDSSYDLILSDISMPEMDGIQFLREMRWIDPDVPVVLVTGAPQVETAMKAIDYGAKGYLVKPVKPAQLQKRVARALHLGELAKLQHEAMILLREKTRADSDRAHHEDVFSRALDSLWMAFQPIVRWSERRIVAYEALMRTREPALPHPGAILEAAQSLGRLHQLGRRVRSLVAGAIASLDEKVLVFVNVHPHELGDEDLYSERAPLSVHAGRVVLEVTERESLDNVSDRESRLQRLRTMGYRLAVDDLASGYSALTSFVQLNPEIVKIDMALVRGVHRSERQQRLIASILGLCKSMGIETVTEGVETLEECHALAGLGAELMQGYLFSAPAEPFTKVRKGVFPDN